MRFNIFSDRHLEAQTKLLEAQFARSEKSQELSRRQSEKFEELTRRQIEVLERIAVALESTKDSG
jgi:hypothetical protein